MTLTRIISHSGNKGVLLWGWSAGMPNICHCCISHQWCHIITCQFTLTTSVECANCVQRNQVSLLGAPLEADTYTYNFTPFSNSRFGQVAWGKESLLSTTLTWLTISLNFLMTTVAQKMRSIQLLPSRWNSIIGTQSMSTHDTQILNAPTTWHRPCSRHWPHINAVLPSWEQSTIR